VQSISPVLAFGDIPQLDRTQAVVQRRSLAVRLYIFKVERFGARPSGDVGSQPALSQRRRAVIGHSTSSTLVSGHGEIDLLHCASHMVLFDHALRQTSGGFPTFGGTPAEGGYALLFRLVNWP
jgi:hypothetical protein